jgi:hypothetical protein
VYPIETIGGIGHPDPRPHLDAQPHPYIGQPVAHEPERKITFSPGTIALWGIASTVSMALCAYHGTKRNDSVGWGIVWGIFGALFPIVTPVIAFAQGFGERRRRGNPRRRRARGLVRKARRLRGVHRRRKRR